MPDASLLHQWIEEKEAELRRLRADGERVKNDIARTVRQVNHLKALLTLEESHPAKQTKLRPAGPAGKFKGISLLEAALAVLQQAREANLDEIVKDLIDGGFDFEGRSPKRTVFLVLKNYAAGKNGKSPITRSGTTFSMKEETN